MQTLYDIGICNLNELFALFHLFLYFSLLDSSLFFGNAVAKPLPLYLEVPNFSTLFWLAYNSPSFILLKLFYSPSSNGGLFPLLKTNKRDRPSIILSGQILIRIKQRINCLDLYNQQTII